MGLIPYRVGIEVKIDTQTPSGRKFSCGCEFCGATAEARLHLNKTSSFATGYINFCASCLKKLRSEIDALKILTTTGLDTK